MRAVLGLSSEWADTKRIVPTAAPTMPTPIPIVESSESVLIELMSLCDDWGQDLGHPAVESSRDLSPKASTPNIDPTTRPVAPIP